MTNDPPHATLRVLHVLPVAAARAGGYVSFALQASVAMQQHGVESIIYASDLSCLPTARDKSRLKPEDLPYDASTLEIRLTRVRAPRRLVNSWQMWRELPRAARHVDIVHIHSLWLIPQLIAFLSSRLGGVPYIVSPHGALDPYLRQRGRVRKRATEFLWQRRMLEGAAALHVTTSEEATLVADIAPHVRRIVVPVGINLDEYRELPDPRDFRRRYLDGHSGAVVLFLGRVTFKKGIDILIRAFAASDPEGSDALLAIVGPDDEDLTPSLRALSHHLGVTSRVRFIPGLFGEARLAALSAADLWVLTSHTENFGVSVLEAAAAGVPIIVSEQVNLAPALSADGAAVVVSLDHESIGAVMRSVLADPSRASQLKTSARAFAARYDWALVAPELASHYRRVAGAANGSRCDRCVASSTNAPMDASEANRLFYMDEAKAYDATEDCLRNSRQQGRLQTILTEALQHLPPDPQVLDACGGTGNVGVALHPRGILPVVVDVSPDMTALWRSKAESLGMEPEIHLETVESFLAADGRTWDLVTFASALHHLEDYTRVLLAAGDHLAPGGVIATVFDPTLATPRLRALRRIDFATWLLFRRPLHFGRLLAARLSRPRRRSSGHDEHLGRLAERHAYAGIDDADLVRAADAHGLEVLVHRRHFDARIAAIRVGLRVVNSPSSFDLILRRPNDY